MSANAVSNTITSMRGLFHEDGDNASDTEAAIKTLTRKEYMFHCGNAATNVNAAFTVDSGENLKLVEAFFNCSEGALDNTADNTVIFTVSCNGNAAISLNTESVDNVAVGATQTFSITAANAIALAGETVRWTLVRDAAADCVGNLVLRFDVWDVQ